MFDRLIDSYVEADAFPFIYARFEDKQGRVIYEHSILSLDDPVTQFIPEFADLKVAVSADGADLSVIEDKDAACPLQQVPMNSDMTVLDLINHQAVYLRCA